MPHMLGTLDLALRLGTSVVASALIGIDREMHAKPVGVRTLGLVGLGSALITLAGCGFSGGDIDANVSRTIQGVVTGIGFLGAGVIVKSESGGIHGLTTAAAILVTTAIGIASGLCCYVPVVLAVVLALVAIGIGGAIDDILQSRLKRPEDRQKLGEKGAARSRLDPLDSRNGMAVDRALGRPS